MFQQCLRRFQTVNSGHTVNLIKFTMKLSHRCFVMTIIAGISQILLVSAIVASDKLVKTTEIIDYKLSHEEIINLRKYGEHMKNILSPEIDVCNNFNGFVCNSQKWRNNIHDTEITLWNTTNDYKILKNYLEQNDKLSLPEEKLKLYIQAIEDNNEISDHEKMDIVKEFINDFIKSNSHLIGEWPITNQINPEKFKLESFIGLSQKLFMFRQEFYFIPLFKIDPNSQRRVLRLKRFRATDADLDDSYEATTRQLNENIKEKLKYFDISNPNEILNDVRHFEMKYDGIYTTSDIRRELNFAALKRDYPNFDWVAYIEAMTTYEKLDDDHPIEIEDVENFKANLKFITSKENRKIAANYFFYKFVQGTYQTDSSILLSRFFYRYSHFTPVITKILSKLYLGETRYQAIEELIDLIFQNFHEYDKFLNYHNILRTKKDFCPDFNDKEFKTIYKNLEISPRNIYKNYYIATEPGIEDDLHSRRDIFKEFENGNFFLHVKKSLGKPIALNYGIIGNYLMDLQIDHMKNQSLYDTARSLFSSCAIDKSVIANSWTDLLRIQILGKIFIEWFKKNENAVVKAENEILKEYGISNEKLLFIEMLNCSRYDKVKRNDLVTLLGSLKYASEVFNCSVGTAMNPRETCYYDDMKLN